MKHLSKLINRFFEKPTTVFWTSCAILAISAITLTTTLVVSGREHRRLYSQSAALSGFAPGQTVRMGAASVSVSGPTYTSGTGHFVAPAGRQYLTLDFTVKNYSDKPIAILPSTDTYVKDGSGAVVYLTPYGLERPFRAGELLPGERVTGQLSYLVPAKTPLRFYVDSIWSGGVVPIGIRE